MRNKFEIFVNFERDYCDNQFIIGAQKYYAKDVMKKTGIYFKIKFMIESEVYAELSNI